MRLARVRNAVRHALFCREVSARIARYATAHILLVACPLFTVGLGLALIASHSQIDRSPTFSVALLIAPVYVWAAVFLAFGGAIAYALSYSLRATQTLTLILAILYAVWATLLGVGAATQNGISTGFIAYLALSTMTSAASAAARKAPK